MNAEQRSGNSIRTVPDVEFGEYKNVDRKLAGPRTYQEIAVLNDTVLNKNYLEFPKWAGYYLPLNTIDAVVAIDIDNDEIQETVIYYSCRGCNAPPRSLDIVKDGRIIFTADGANLSLTPLTDKKGFNLETKTIPRNYGDFTRVKFLFNSDSELFPYSEEDIGIWYGTPVKISLSGDFRFNRTDKEGKIVANSTWFWAIPAESSESEKDRIADLLWKNPEGIYEITGTRDSDECNYYESGPLVGTCIQTILAEDITLIK